MPGYKSLSDHVTGDVADDVRRAEVLLRSGEREEAVLVFEATLAEFARTSGALPGWLCGRLAVLYRSLGRHDDEVSLLERYRESQTSDDARTRYDARLSKAQALAERAHKRETTALSSVRLVIRGAKESSRRARAVVLADVESPAANEVLSEALSQPTETGAFSAATILAVRRALAADSLGERATPPLDDALGMLTQEARAHGLPAEQAVIALKGAWKSARRPTIVGPREWDGVYGSSLMTMLELFFEGR